MNQKIPIEVVQNFNIYLSTSWKDWMSWEKNTIELRHRPNKQTVRPISYNVHEVAKKGNTWLLSIGKRSVQILEDDGLTSASAVKLVDLEKLVEGTLNLRKVIKTGIKDRLCLRIVERLLYQTST